jgi:hypothetical protein
MGKPVSFQAKKFRTEKLRGLRQRLVALLLSEFPRFGGERMAGHGADLLMETIEQNLVARECLVHGQVLFACYPLETPPPRRKFERIQLVPVILDLFTLEEIDALVAASKPRPQQTADRAVRLCRQAHAQGGLLSNSDLAILTGVCNKYIAVLLQQYERAHNVVVPRRATLHDCGSGLSHKAIICRQRYLEGKQPHEIARDTFHSPEAVNAYLSRFERVRLCRNKGMSAEQTAHILSCSVRLVREYLALDESMERQPKENEI